ncbi:MAG: carboxylesterase family protein [Thermodesulfobacteriota bacterium]|nr:carboxylesterase family protein [Thermodesulfobacteriota bacterium]
MGKYLRTIFLFTFIVFFLMGGCSSSSDSDIGFIPQIEEEEEATPPIRETMYGEVEGIEADANTWAWLGIPYAKPPVGELRWKAPQDPEPWDGVRGCTEFCSECSQPAMGRTWVPLDYIIGSEDCLYLNIWRPQSDETGLPVYFWIHGGSNNFGTVKDYNGAGIAGRLNMVVVVIQYRLGPLGWFTHPALRSGENAYEDSGNFGTLDTVKALEWVKNNIAFFGGDPNNVTIAGESAGAHNVTNLLIAPLAAGLFHRAISESGGMSTIPVGTGVKMANDTIEMLLIADGTAANKFWAALYRITMTDAEIEEYLRGKPAEDIINAQINKKAGSMDVHSAYEDGAVVPGSVISAIESGDYNKVPIVLGSNEYEVKSFLPLVGHVMEIKTSSNYTWFDLYKVLDPDDPLTFENVMPAQYDRDLYEACGYYGSRNWKAEYVDSIARKLKEKQDNVYAYLFKWGGPGSGPQPFDFIFGAGHAMEIPFFWGSDESLFGYSFTEENRPGRQALQDAMMTYMAQFARDGDPNEAGLPVWEQWSNNEGEPKAIVFDATLEDANIGMMSEEVTEEGVLEEVKKLDLFTRFVIGLLLLVF